MDDEIEDVVGDVKLTESQKSIAMSNVYSMDFTDSSSEKHNSSGMETYVLEWDSEDSESSALQSNVSIISMKDKPAKPVLISRDAQCEVAKKLSKASSASFNKCSIIAQEIFTQTSKTIIELAESDGAVRKPIGSKTLETQTSIISITENKTVEYRFEVSGATQNLTRNEIMGDSGDNPRNNISCHQIFPNSLDDGSSKFVISETENEKTDDYISDNSSHTNDKLIANDDFKGNILCDEQNEYENTSEFEQSPDVTDIEEDSLMEPKRKVNKNDNHSGSSNTHISVDSSYTPRSVDNDVAELYTKLSESMEFRMLTPSDHEKKRFGYLTPLTEESVAKKDSTVDVTVNAAGNNGTIQNEEDKDVLFTNNAGIKVKLFPKADCSKESESFKLPPIQGNYNCSDGNLNFLFTINHNKVVTKNNNLPFVHEERKERSADRWEIGTKDLASGESPLISGRSESERPSHATVQLPPIHAEGYVTNSSSKADQYVTNVSKTEILAVESPCPISIKDKIKELKASHRPRNSWSHSKYMHGTDSRSGSPSTVSPDEIRMTDAAERGCELLCLELLKRLRSHSWFEVADALDDLPRVLDKFWDVIAEHRIADLIRQVTSQVESPRTQVARAACNTLAMILKNTNYTKKPVMAVIACRCDLLQQHATTVTTWKQIVSHKSALVRCASARLLVVCCALGGGGRDLLRARPPTAACARKHALQSLASLLDDKSIDARKYAERLYSMLRPLANFEAYYLTDVDVEVASRQMKKYDQLLLCGPPESR